MGDAPNARSLDRKFGESVSKSRTLTKINSDKPRFLVRKQQCIHFALGVRDAPQHAPDDTVIGSGYVVPRSPRAVLPAQFKATELAHHAKVDGQALSSSGLRVAVPRGACVSVHRTRGLGAG